MGDSSDTLWCTIYPDSNVAGSTPLEDLQNLHLQILRFLSPFTASYIWQHTPFSLYVFPSPIPHLEGSLRFGDNVDDEWFLVFLLFTLSHAFPYLSIRIWDSDGEFLLIEAAFHLPRWLVPDTSVNRVFIRKGEVYIIPKSKFPNQVRLTEALNCLVHEERACLATDGVQSAIRKKIQDFPGKAERNMHKVRVRVPVSVAVVLKEEPAFISLAVEGFYDRDVDTMKHASRMQRFLRNGKEDMVLVSVKLSRAMYAQLMQQRFQAPKCYPMPKGREWSEVMKEAELGMKIACGCEMMYCRRKEEGEEGKGNAWRKYVDTLQQSGFFKGLLPGSSEYKILMNKAEEYYRNSSMYRRTSEMLNAPVRRIDEILSQPYSCEDFNSEVPETDDDSWLYDGEDELNSVLKQREEEMDMYEVKQKQNKSGNSENLVDRASSSNLDACDPSEMAKAMHAFCNKISSYKGAEVPKDRELKAVELDVGRFLKDIESVMNLQGREDVPSDLEFEDESTSDVDFDSGDEDDMGNDESGDDLFMQAYSSALNEQLNETTLKNSFVRGNGENSAQKLEPSASTEKVDEFTPVDVDFNLVKSLVDSFSSQQGQPGPASNLLGLMGLTLQQESDKSK